MKYCFIINPASGKDSTKQGLENRIMESAAKAEADVTVMYTTQVGDMQKYIREFSAKNAGEEIRFYACGGDGTVCEAVNGVMSAEGRERLSLGIIPVGTGNDFVRNFDGKENFFDADAQINATAMKIDLIKCNDFYAANMINIGFDCQVVVKTAEFKRRRFVPSKLAYIFGLVATLVKKPGVSMKVSKDGGEPEHKELLLTTFANGSFCGGGFYSNPNASLTSGALNSLFVNDVTRIKFISLVGDYKKGTHLCEKFAKIIVEDNAFEYFLEFASPTNISVDGEIVTLESLRISCEKQALNILVPKGAALRGQKAENEQTVSV